MILLSVLIFPLLLFVAAVYDVATMTIPNWISSLLVAFFLMIGVFLGLPLLQIAISLGVGFGFLVIGMIMFALGWIGGGDAKLFAACGVWFGWPSALVFAVFMMMCGGVVCILLVGFRMTNIPQPVLSVQWVERLHRSGEGLPYGVPIAVGALLVFTQTPLWILAIG